MQRFFVERAFNFFGKSCVHQQEPPSLKNWISDKQICVYTGWQKRQGLCSTGYHFQINSSLNQEQFQFLPAPLENQCRSLQLKFCSMGKRVQSTGSKRSQLVVRASICSGPTVRLSPLNSQHQQGTFSYLLSQLHQQSNNPQSQMHQFRTLTAPQAIDLLHFFNHQKYYSKIELHCYVICLANLITLANAPSSQIITTQFKAKIRKFLRHLSEEENTTSTTYSNKVQAVFYILAVIIFRQRNAKQNNGKTRIRSIIADKGIMRAFLDISIPPNAKISKFYGIIMLAITTRSHPKAVRQVIMRNIFINMSRFDHKQTFFNILTHLRSEKNKIKINLKDLKQGNVIKVLTDGYQKYIQQYQSFYMLDYLFHLLGLFPSLVETAMDEEFAVLLVKHLQLRIMHHPMHETTILNFISKGLTFLDESSRQKIITAIHQLQPAEIYTQSKIVKLLVEQESCQNILKRIADKDFLMMFLNSIQPTLERNVLISTVELVLSATKRLESVNNHVSIYITWLLKNKLRLLDDPELLGMVQASSQ